MTNPIHPSPRIAALVTAGLALLATAACASLTPLQQEAVAKVQVIHLTPALNCQNLGVVTGSRESAEPDGIRAKAVFKGANVVHLERDGVATALYCPDSAVEPTGEEPTP